MKKHRLGEFEEIVLLVVSVQHDHAYGISVTKSIEEELGRSVTLSSVHTALYRMADKGLVRSRMGGATSSRGGRRKRIYTVTNAGKNALWEAQKARNKLWSMMPEKMFEAWQM